jgi:hypothetical protein
MEWRDLPPGGLIPQHQTKPGPRGRDLVMGGPKWGDTKLQHSATIGGGRAANAVTALGKRDNFNLERLSSQFLFSNVFRFQRKPDRWTA